MSRLPRRLSALALAGLLAHCSKAPAPGDAAAPASLEAASSGGAAASRDAGATLAKPAADGPMTFSGEYDAVAGTLYVPDGGDYAGVKFRGLTSDQGLGKGTLRIDIDALGRATGSLDGALGALTLSGALTDKTILTARLAPAAPTSGGYYGTVTAVLSPAGELTGSLNVSLHDASLIREAKLSLKRK